MPKYDDYNRVSDIVLHLTPDSTVKLNTTLYKIMQNREKKSFHSEVQHGSGIKVTRDFNFSYTIEKRDADEFFSILIRPHDMILLEKKMDLVTKWFEGNKTFIIKDKKLTITATKSVNLAGLCNNTYLQFDPIVYQFDESSPVAPGVRITLGKPEAFIDIDVNKWYAFAYLMRGDMFARSQNQLSYMGRPEFGTNLYVMDAFESKPVSSIYKKPLESNIVTKRGVQSNIIKKKSFFDITN